MPAAKEFSSRVRKLGRVRRGCFRAGYSSLPERASTESPLQVPQQQQTTTFTSTTRHTAVDVDPLKHVSRLPSPVPLTSQHRGINISALDASKGNRERIVILGSGWGGYSMARKLDTSRFQVVIVSPRSYFVFTPLLASTCVGTLEFRTVLEPIRRRRSKLEYIQGWADNVNFHAKTITIEEAVADPEQGHALVTSRKEGKSIETLDREAAEMTAKGDLFDLKYDKLVVAVGSYSQTFQTPGVKEYANFLKDVGDARQIRKRILECFEAAELPTTTDDVRRQILSFCLVGGGPTGMETAAELHDFIKQDLNRLYPDLIKFVSVTVYDVAPKVLSAFDDKLVQYTEKIFKREGIHIKTSRRIERLSPGLPGRDAAEFARRPLGLTLRIKGEGDVGIGMCIWSTGLMMNPFIESALNEVRRFPGHEVIYKAAVDDAATTKWTISRDPRTGSIVTNDRLRIILQAEERPGVQVKAAFMRDVFAIGDCARVEGQNYPLTAQVASHKADWLAARLNRGDLQSVRFFYKSLGFMAYIGDMRAIFQGSEAGFTNLSGRAAWLVWRGAYLWRSMSWRNRVLIPTYWVLNAVFGRDVSRF